MNKKEKIIAHILAIAILSTLLLANGLIWYGILNLFTWLFHIQMVITFQDGFVIGEIIFILIYCILEVCEHE